MNDEWFDVDDLLGTTVGKRYTKYSQEIYVTSSIDPEDGDPILLSESMKNLWLQVLLAFINNSTPRTYERMEERVATLWCNSMDAACGCDVRGLAKKNDVCHCDECIVRWHTVDVTETMMKSLETLRDKLWIGVRQEEE